MLILKTIDELKSYRNSLENKTIGFVPTMGALHKGHLSLISKSKEQNDVSIVSIFVNPTQFGENEDFSKYPRNINKDLELCKISGVSAVFLPSTEELYPSSDEVILIPPKNLTNKFEGSLRNGHFSGVLRVVLKFFNLIKPHNAYFGKKDAQQLLIIKKMVNDLFLDINIIACPILRDTNNLALSSRNIYLDSTAYNKALQIPKAIEGVSKAVLGKEINARVIEKIALKELKELDVDYCNVVDLNLDSIEVIKEEESLLLIAVRIDNTRLLDNFWF